MCMFGYVIADLGRLTDEPADWDERKSAAGNSPGGCADLLAMALFMVFCEEDA